MIETLNQAEREMRSYHSLSTEETDDLFKVIETTKTAEKRLTLENNIKSYAGIAEEEIEEGIQNTEP